MIENPYKKLNNFNAYNQLHEAWEDGVQAVVQWLEKPCTEHTQHTLCEGHPYKTIRLSCPKCWQELKQCTT